jgi:hypothetical protein
MQETDYVRLSCRHGRVHALRRLGGDRKNGSGDVLMSRWDIALIVVVSVMGTAVAYLRHPEHKAFVLMLPIPFTLATLALGQPIDATNVLAGALLVGFSFGVWFLRVRLRWPILVVIPFCAVAYCLAGAGIARLNLDSGAAFWCAVVLVYSLAPCSFDGCRTGRNRTIARPCRLGSSCRRSRGWSWGS